MAKLQAQQYHIACTDETVRDKITILKTELHLGSQQAVLEYLLEFHRKNRKDKK